ncbi:helix-turn-helix domain-containing protein [Legionella yabuuchiae]|uniref:helix-turn-helix domain-containing protein n=1 Tax=Legionella yabuuchiae TaxID=376727 RepID=UPI001055D054|nr:helix-turn-helix transcriptional regulator [Legionella yabuuchiae]
MSDDAPNDNKILLKLRDVRRSKGMSLNSLAEKVGIDYQRVGRIERGETQMTVDMLSKISKVLHVPISELLNEDGITEIEDSLSKKSTEKKATVNLIPYIYEKLDEFCSNHNLAADPTVNVHLATILFNAVEDMRANQKDDEGMVLTLFQALDAIFERLVLIKSG